MTGMTRRKIRMRILFVSCTDFISDTHSGGRKCSKRNYDALVAFFGKENVQAIIVTRDMREHNDKKITLIQGTKNRYESFLNTLLGYTRGYAKKNEKTILEYCCENYEYIFLDSSLYGISIKKIRTICNSKIITFFQNIEYMYEKNMARENILYYISAYKMKQNELNVIKYSDSIIALNSRDEKLMQELYGRKPDTLLPISFADNVENIQLNSYMDDNYLLFVGALFGPNISALRWYKDNIAPYVHICLKVVGHNMEKLKNEFSGCENIEIVGTVDDLAIYYLNAKAVVMPILYGDGMKVKTAEALMYGRYLLGTKKFITSIPATPKSRYTSGKYVLTLKLILTK